MPPRRPPPHDKPTSHQPAAAAGLNAWPCLRASGAHTVLDVSVSPNAKKTELVGWHDGALRIRLQAAPVEGAANEALRKWLAQALQLPSSQVQLLRGDTSRRKQWLLQTSPAEVIAWLQVQPTMCKAAAPSGKP